MLEYMDLFLKVRKIINPENSALFAKFLDAVLAHPDPNQYIQQSLEAALTRVQKTDRPRPLDATEYEVRGVDETETTRGGRVRRVTRRATKRFSR